MGFKNIFCFISSSVLIWQYFRAGASRICQLPATRHLFWHPHARPVYHHANRPERCCVQTFQNLQEFIRWNHWSCWNWWELDYINTPPSLFQFVRFTYSEPRFRFERWVWIEAPCLQYLLWGVTSSASCCSKLVQQPRSSSCSCNWQVL